MPKLTNCPYCKRAMERAVNNQAVRISSSNAFTKEILVSIEAEDIEQV